MEDTADTRMDEAQTADDSPHSTMNSTEIGVTNCDEHSESESTSGTIDQAEPEEDGGTSENTVSDESEGHGTVYH